MCVLADLLYYASLNTMVSQEIPIDLQTSLDTMPTVGKHHINI